MLHQCIAHKIMSLQVIITPQKKTLFWNMKTPNVFDQEFFKFD